MVIALDLDSLKTKEIAISLNFSFDYRADKEIKIVPSQPIATDGLLIRGLYHVITLAIYGEPTPEEPTPSPYMPSGQVRTTPGGAMPSSISPTQNAPRALMLGHTPTSLAAASAWPAPILEFPRGVPSQIFFRVTFCKVQPSFDPLT